MIRTARADWVCTNEGTSYNTIRYWYGDICFGRGFLFILLLVGECSLGMLRGKEGPRGREREREKKGVCLCFANTGIHHGGMLAAIPRMPWAPAFVLPSRSWHCFDSTTVVPATLAITSSHDMVLHDPPSISPPLRTPPLAVWGWLGLNGRGVISYYHNTGNSA